MMGGTVVMASRSEDDTMKVTNAVKVLALLLIIFQLKQFVGRG